MFFSAVKNKVEWVSVGLSVPAATVTSDVVSTVSLGCTAVMNLYFYRARASESLTPPPSRRRSSIYLCFRWTIASIYSIACTTAQLRRAIRARTCERSMWNVTRSNVTGCVNRGDEEIDERDKEKFGTLDSSETTITILGDRWWPQSIDGETGYITTWEKRNERPNVGHVFNIWNLNILHLERDAWSRDQWSLDQGKEQISTPPPCARCADVFDWTRWLVRRCLTDKHRKPVDGSFTDPCPFASPDFRPELIVASTNCFGPSSGRADWRYQILWSHT